MKILGGGGGGGGSGGEVVLGILPVPERPAYLNYSKARASALATGAGGGYLDIFSFHLSFLFFLPLSGRRPDIY